MRQLFLLIITVLFTQLGQAQNTVASVIKKLNEAYGNNANMGVTTTYKMYPNFTTTTAAQTLTSTLKKKGDKLYYKLDNVERLETHSRRIMINHDSKTVIVHPNDAERKTYVMDLELEKFLTQKTIGQLQEQPTQFILTIPLTTPDIEKIELSINKNTYLIEKMIVFYRKAIRFQSADDSEPKEKPRMEMTFQITPNPTFAGNEFAESKFIKVTNGVIKLNSALTDYQLVNFDND